MIAEKISRLNPKTTNFSQSTGGGHSDDSPLDIAAALGMGNLPRAAYLFALIKFADQKENYDELLFLVRRRALAMRIKSGKKQADRYFLGVTKTALDNAIGWDICHWCKGVGKRRHVHKKGVTDCVKCSGTGKLKPTVFEVAKSAKIPRSTFKDSYAKEYGELIKYFDHLIDRIETHLFIYYYRRGGQLSGSDSVTA